MSLLRRKSMSVTAREGENPRGYMCINIKYALTAGYNATQHAQGRIWNIPGRRHLLIFSKYGLSGMVNKVETCFKVLFQSWKINHIIWIITDWFHSYSLHAHYIETAVLPILHLNYIVELFYRVKLVYKSYSTQKFSGYNMNSAFLVVKCVCFINFQSMVFFFHHMIFFFSFRTESFNFMWAL